MSSTQTTMASEDKEIREWRRSVVALVFISTYSATSLSANLTATQANSAPAATGVTLAAAAADGDEPSLCDCVVN